MLTTCFWLLWGVASVGGVLWAVRLSPARRDGAYVAVVVAWLVWLGADLWLTAVPGSAVAAALQRLSCQAMWLGAAVLLCDSAHTRRPSRQWLLYGFALSGGVLALLADAAVWPDLGPQIRPLWLGLNGLGGLVVVLALAQELRQRPAAPGWMALLIAISGLSVLLSDWQAMRAGLWELAGHHFFLVVALFAFWLASRRRLSDPPPTGWMDRRQLAQELHDGVGSQLVSILSTLDANSPQQRLTATSLQNCLLDLKLMVDGMDADASLMSHLASLRYRMHPLLEGAGIRMEWLVTNEERLLRVRGEAARHVLRLTQEALANVIHHSHARTVMVLCRYRCEIDSLLLCVADDGSGIDPQRRSAMGKGLSGMRQRAQALGGRLRVESGAEGGTVIQLTVPMARLLSGAPTPRRTPYPRRATRTPG